MSSRKNGLLEKYDLFIFDWDGTLNSIRLLFRINETVKRALHIWNKDSSVKYFEDKGYDARKGLEERKNNTMYYLMDMFLNMSKSKLHNDSFRMLAELKRRGKRVALYSNGRGQRLARELQELGIHNYFDVVISAQDIGTMKPNPTGIRIIMKRLRIKPSRTLYIGDMVDDILTARFAKVDCCAIADGFDSYHMLKSTAPDHIFRTIEELYKAL